jgi:hypothetical protein
MARGLSKIDHTPSMEWGHTRMMVSKSKMLTCEEFASLLTVGNTSAVLEPPAVIPAEHSARLIVLGYMADLAGRLRMTTAGRARIAAESRNILCRQSGAENQKGPLLKFKRDHSLYK